MRRPLTVLFSLLAALGLVLASPALASAHDVLQKTTPSDGQSLQRMPTSVSLQFSEPPLAIGVQVLVTGPAGEVATGTATIEGGTVVQAISPTAPAGDYTVTYRVTADDGHPVGGTFTFRASAGQDGTVAATNGSKSLAPATTLPAGAPATAAARTSATADQQSSVVPTLLSVLGVLIAIVIGAFVVLRSRRRV